jgi:uncharacterized protein (DUF488 family)
MDECAVFTFGPEQPWKTFLQALKTMKVQTLADVRSEPDASQGGDYSPPVLQAVLAESDITYVHCTPQAGVKQARQEARLRRFALLCSTDNTTLPCHFSTIGVLLSGDSGLCIHHIFSEKRQTEVFTIGVTRHNAPEFFGALKQAGVKRLLDVRLNNWTQLAGFTKRDDLRFFLKELCGMDYMHELLLAPSRELLNAYKKKGGDWQQYERDFLALMAERRVEDQLPNSLFDIPTVLLCYEATADYCHRRLVLDYLQEKWGGLKITHL